jgi:ATP-dependent RNA helicase RhlE
MKFSDLNLNKSLLNALEDLGLDSPTSIQSKVFSIVMSGKDMGGIAQTGTGKTLAYLLPLMRMWTFSKDKLPQIVVLVPTRELVVQVLETAKKLASYISFDAVGVYGGVNIKTQVLELSKGCDLLVATPGRFIDLAASGSLKVKNIKKLVIDEFDMMLDLGFRPQLQTIFDKIPERRQNLLFSATISEEVEDLLDETFKSPEILEDVAVGTPHQNIEQRAYFIPNFNTKINFIELLLANDSQMTKNLVFVGNKLLADTIFEELKMREVESVDVIHSNKSQNYRFKALDSFTKGETRTLIATDLGSRGLDIPKISHVINMDIPEIAEDYIHRIGRTGRGNEKGISISFISEKEQESFEEIETLMNYKVPIGETPVYLEISDSLMSFEIEKIDMKILAPKKKIDVGEAFHEKAEKNKKVNKRRDIEAEKKAKYGKAYKKERKL